MAGKHVRVTADGEVRFDRARPRFVDRMPRHRWGRPSVAQQLAAPTPPKPATQHVGSFGTLFPDEQMRRRSR